LAHPPGKLNEQRFAANKNATTLGLVTISQMLPTKINNKRHVRYGKTFMQQHVFL